MTSFEGMWKFQSGSVQDPNALVWGGVTVLEGGRILGGDSAMAYLGRYEIAAGALVSEVRVWTWNTQLPADRIDNVFGMLGPVDFLVQLAGRREGATITGSLWPSDSEQMKLRFRMEKLAELP